MKLKRLFQVLVLGGASLVAVAACGGSESNPPPGNSVSPPGSLLPDGGVPGPNDPPGPRIW